MWIEIVATFLLVSILLYCLLGGADFGAGILELFRGPSFREEQQELIGHAIGPVWEANHMWLILAVVILFNGFPKAYATLTTTFHIPLTLMLIGVILRGCAFTFRHYDAVRDRSQHYYTLTFMVSSLLTPLMLGVIAGALFLGRVPPLDGGFHESYISPWFNLFSFSVGIFACVLFAFLAAVYLVGEAWTEDLRKLFSERARVINFVAVIAGSFVFLSAHIDGLKLTQAFISDPTALVCIALATLILIPLWMSLHRRDLTVSRLLAGSQVALILLGWLKLQFPAFLQTREAGNSVALTIYNTAAPDATLRFLAYALIGGIAVIFPALFYLLHIFKRQEKILQGDS